MFLHYSQPPPLLLLLLLLSISAVKAHPEKED